MTTKPNQPNLIATPPHLHIRIAITIDPNTQQSEMKIERGKITNIQLATMLNEHATNILRRLTLAEAGIVQSQYPAQPNGGNDNGTAS